MGDLFRDIRYAARGLVKTPGFALIVVLSIGIGIGANTTVFAWLESLVLHPFPLVPDDSALVLIKATAIGGKERSIAYPDYLDWREASRTFEGMAVHTATRMSLRLGDEPADRVWGQLVSAGYFDLLGVQPLLGRGFRPEEEKAASPVAVISRGLWERRFGSDPGAVGRSVFVNGHALTVIGVAPPRFEGSFIGLGFDLWAPVTLQPLLRAGGESVMNRGWQWLDGFARLKAGVTQAQADDELRRVAERVGRDHGIEGAGALVRPIREQSAGKLLLPLFSALLGVTALVLLIGCANVANLLLARAAGRGKEIGVRLALGASRGRIVRQLLAESVLLSAIGGAVGCLVAIWSRNLIVALVPPTPYPVHLTVDLGPRVFLYAAALTLLTAMVFGLLPALRASRGDLVSSLKEETAGGGRSTLRSALVVSQVALCLVSLVCAGLFLRSVDAAAKADIGIADPDRLLLVGTDLNLAGLERDAALQATRDLLERARALPGVSAAAVATMVPLGFGGHSQSGARVEGYAPGKDENMSIERVLVSDGYFDAMGIPLESGRPILASDREKTALVVVVNEAFARRYWPGRNAIGGRLNQGPGWATVVGVAKDSAYDDLGEAPYPVVYYPIAQWYQPGITLHVRADGNARALVEPLRREFAAASRDLPFLDPRTLTEHMAASTFTQRSGASLLSAMGALALFLATAGIYGVLGFMVQRRRREIAIRVALGAPRGGLIRLVVDEAFRLAAVGLAAGAALALGAAYLLRSQLFGITPADPITFGAIALLLLAATAVASLVPVRRALRVDPVVALRSE